MCAVRARRPCHDDLHNTTVCPLRARLAELAHQWKGASSYICAKHTQRAALRLEQGAKALHQASVSPSAASPSASPSASLSDNSYLHKEVAFALYELQIELQRVMPLVRKAIAEIS